jgi:hypothetical protein
LPRPAAAPEWRQVSAVVHVALRPCRIHGPVPASSRRKRLAPRCLRCMVIALAAATFPSMTARRG